MSTSKVVTLAEAVAEHVPDGAQIGFGGGNALWRRPTAFARELVRQQRRGLHLFHMIGGVETDMLIGAGALASTNTCYVGLDDLGQSPHFQQVAVDGSVQINEYSEFTFVASLRAANMGLPFIPWKTAWGTDVAKTRGWATVQCPYTGMELLAVPATELDVVVIQVDQCDEQGNVQMTDPPDFIHDFDVLIARAAKVVVVCAERVGPLSDPRRTMMIGREVDCVVSAPGGAWPAGFIPHYGVDTRHLVDTYIPATKSPELFAQYLQEHVVPSETTHG